MPITSEQLDPANLELTPGEMRTFADSVVSRVISHITSLPAQSASGDVRAEALCASMREPAPEKPAPFEPLMDALFEQWIPRSFTAPGPGYLAFIPGGGLFPAALANFISDGTNRFTGVWQAAPALVQLEANALEWLRDWMGFPGTTRGLFTTGGSMANFNAILCARERLHPDHVRSATMYTSSHAHHSVVKSAKLAGIFPDRVREIEVDDAFRMRVEALEASVFEDRRRGLRPFLVVSTAGTTNTGAVDPLAECGALCAREGLWHHVDGAYGAFFHAVPELRHLLIGLSDADSLTLDPHKGLFLPYGTGALLVRDGRTLRATHSGHAAGYLPAMPDAERFYDPSSHGPDLSRGFPGLRVWLCVKIFGAEKLRAAIAEKRALAVDAAARIARIPGVRMMAPPQLSLFAFYVSRVGATLEEENEATRRLLDLVTARGRVMLTGCSVGDRFLARVCVLSFRTRQDRIDACVEDVTHATSELLGE